MHRKPIHEIVNSPRNIFTQNKTKETYVRHLQKVKQLLPGILPVTVLTDFEPAIVSAIIEVFPRAMLFPVLPMYISTNSSRIFKNRFVLMENIMDSFERLSDENILAPNAQAVADYFEDT